MKSNIMWLYSFTRGLGIRLAVLATVLTFSTQLRAQEASTYVCSTGKIHFFSPAVTGDVEATTHSAVCVLNTQTKKVFAKAQQTGFSFKEKLMQEHFNENYMETDKYPYAVLEMIITDNIPLTKDGTFDITLKGTLELHGVKVTREIKGKLVIRNGHPVNATATFNVNLADHKIKIPKILGAHVADDVKVDVDFNFEKYKGT